MANCLVIHKRGIMDISTDQGTNFRLAIVGFVARAVVKLPSPTNRPEPEAELAGLLYGTEPPTPTTWQTRSTVVGTSSPRSSTGAPSP